MLSSHGTLWTKRDQIQGLAPSTMPQPHQQTATNALLLTWLPPPLPPRPLLPPLPPPLPPPLLAWVSFRPSCQRFVFLARTPAPRSSQNIECLRATVAFRLVYRSENNFVGMEHISACGAHEKHTVRVFPSAHCQAQSRCTDSHAHLSCFPLLRPGASSLAAFQPPLLPCVSRLRRLGPC